MYFHNGNRSTEGKANAFYEEMTNENFSNVLARKRQIAMTRDRGDEKKAIEMLVAFFNVPKETAIAILNGARSPTVV